MCYKAFGDIDSTYVEHGKRNEFKLVGIKVGSKLHYNRKTRKLENDRTIASLDPGIRCFITDNEVLKIGPDVYKKIKSLLIRIDVVNRKWKRGKTRTKEKMDRAI